MTATPEPTFLVEGASELRGTSDTIGSDVYTTIFPAFILMPVVYSQHSSHAETFKWKSDPIVPFSKFSCGSSLHPVLEHVGSF